MDHTVVDLEVVDERYRQPIGRPYVTAQRSRTPGEPQGIDRQGSPAPTRVTSPSPGRACGDDDAAGSARLPGRPLKLSQPELLCLAVMQAMLGLHCEARWLRHARKHLGHLFPFIPAQPGYNKRLRAALPQIKRIIRTLAADTDFWHDTVWLTDSTPVPCGMSRPTAKRSEMAGWANYGYCASHSRFFWGLRLYLVCTPAGMPMLWALADPKIEEREVLAAMGRSTPT